VRKLAVMMVSTLIVLSISSSVRAAEPLPEPFPVHRASIWVDPQKNKLSLVIDGTVVRQYPVSLGKISTPTPVGEWKVINKFENWGSGFGTRWIGLDVPWGVYGIHGTNRPNSIGLDASHGCVRMYNRHVEQLFTLVELGTPVYIVGHALGELYNEPRDLAIGEAGADVMLIQSRLRSAGYYNGECHGKFTPSTTQALEQYERDQGLPVDGVINQHDYISFGLLE
jgi:L,D-transpeptidase catalytic domain/Putative peptidoglycan binding domain